MYMRVAFWCCLSTVSKVEAHQALPCAAIVRTMYEHMQLQVGYESQVTTTAAAQD